MNIVRTKEDLKAAKDRGDEEILIEGELVTELRRSRSLIYCSAGGIAVITAAIAAAPFTSGLSLAAAAAMTGTELAVIIFAVSIGLGLLLAIWRGYDEIEFSAGPPPSMKLRKKHK